MKYFLKIITVFFLLFNYTNVHAQQNNDFLKEWKEVESSEAQGLTQDAIKEVNQIFDRAIAAGIQPQQIKAAMYLMKYRNMVQEDNQANNLFYIDTLITKTKAPARNILQSMQAELFASYLNNHRYDLYDRTTIVAENSADITTWSIAKLHATSKQLYKASLNDKLLLQNTPINDYEAILTPGKNTRSLRATLFDFLAHRALDHFISADDGLPSSAGNKFIINDEKAFAPIPLFVAHRFTTTDTISSYFDALQLLQQILAFHQNDANKDPLLDADLIRLAFVQQNGVFSNKEKLYSAALLQIEETYPSSSFAGLAMFLRAQEWQNKGMEYSRSNKTNQFDLIKAIEIARTIQQKYPGTEGSKKSSNLIADISQPSFNVTTEKVNLPNEPMRSLATYRNVPSLHFRLIKTNRIEMELLGSDNDLTWQALINMPVLRSWNQVLPDEKDYQEHSTEIKIDALPLGTYMLLASVKPDFTLTDNILSSQMLYISNISYIENNENEIFVLHRKTGQPLSNATIQVWENEYDYGSRKNSSKPGEKFTSDANGFANIQLDQRKYNTRLQILYKKDELFTDDGYYHYDYNSFYGNKQVKTFLFADRSIYRPGQTIFFKGIVLSKDDSLKTNNVIANYKSTMLLVNSNGEKAGSVEVTSNEFGSFTGNFVLPTGVLNGNFSLIDSSTKDAFYFSVEEYKRPKFLTSIDKPSGTYRLNDTIVVKGKATAFAGNSINDAKVSYRVVRRTRYPIWWGWGNYGKFMPPFGNNVSTEITNGFTSTDADGNFVIKFKAIPDEKINAKDPVTFYYEVSADVTDLNGETRSASNDVAVARHALELNVSLPEKIAAADFKKIQVLSTNLNGLFEKAKVQLELFSLQQPNKMYRERYWETPDLFVMDKKTFESIFLYDEYANEADPKNWSINKREWATTDTTQLNGSFNVQFKTIQPGFYKLIASTTDQLGELVKTEKIIRIFDPKKPSALEPFVLDVKKATATPGESLAYDFHTGFDKIWLINQLTKMDKSTALEYGNLTKKKGMQKKLAIAEKDRGGMAMQYMFVMNNRFYNGGSNFDIPWSNKALNITYETFRDKLLPGNKEEWKVKISGINSDKVAAEMMVNMYDASLDQFKQHDWEKLSSIWPKLNSYNSWTSKNFSSERPNLKHNWRDTYVILEEKYYDVLVNNGWNEGNYGFARHMKLSKADPGAELDLAPVPAEINQVKFDTTKFDVASEVKPEKINITKNTSPNINTRSNLKETAFFFPQLKTDAAGNVTFSFDIPEALTQWKLMTMVHDKSLASGYDERTVLTQKPLMVQPNGPRFMREGDAMELVTKVANQSKEEITGTVQLELFDAINNKSVDGWLKNIFPTQYFTAPAGQSVAVKFPIEIPFYFSGALTYRIKAISQDQSFSDGEENTIPVFTNRMLVTESLPLNVRNTNSKTFKFEKLLQSSNSETLKNHTLTVTYSSNPSWYVVQALPYLMENKDDNADQHFNRLYANTLAESIASSSPKVAAIFNQWKNLDTAALQSNLQKNEALKAALLEETPWVLDAKNEQAQKKNIAVLFDLVKLSAETKNSLTQLQNMQLPNGGFSWFKGGPDDRYITQYILTGIGHLKKLNVLNATDAANLQPMINNALVYLDARIKDEYDQLLKYKANLAEKQLTATAIQYGYMRSFFTEIPVPEASIPAVNFYKEQSKMFWVKESKYMQAMIALSLHRNNQTSVAQAILKSLHQNAIVKEDLGMYWKEFNTAGYYWHQAPIEAQALMIEAFSDIENNTRVVTDLKTWLLTQKQTNNWRSSRATADACYALLLGGSSNWIAEEAEVNIQLGETNITSTANKTEAGSGYFSETIVAEKVKPAMGNIVVNVKRPDNQNSQPGFGAVYWQYTEDLDKITPAATPLQLEKKIYKESNSDNGVVLTELKEGDVLKVGDKINIRIVLKVDRNMEYVHMKDMRAAAMEPINVLSGYKWQGGLGYYESTKDASTHFFFGNLPRGSYVFEYGLFTTHAGNFSNGITSIQCMYAPEFTSHSEGIRINIEQ
jgi:uncharacterized protein YfaS (alpha-2-macroglobulin family)